MITREFRRAVLQALGGWTNWTPSYGASASMTYGSVTTLFARYWQISKIVYFAISASGTTGGTTSNTLTFTLPVPAVDASVRTIGNGILTETGTTAKSAFCFMNSSATVASVRRYDSGNLTIQAGEGFNIVGLYECA